MGALLKIKSLSKSFGPLKAVNNLSFNLDRGEVLGFLGPNGAGKTTTMRMLTGFISPSNGEILINNYNLLENLELCRKHIGYVPEGSPLYQEMNSIDFLKFAAKIRRINHLNLDKALNRVIDLLNLKSILFQKIDTLSKGYKRRIGLAQAIIHDPDILILDEPTDGLDPNQKNEVRKLIRKLGKDKAIIISTHILEEVTAICNRAMIIAKGKLLLDEKPRNLLKKSETYNRIFISIEEKKPSELKQILLKNDFIQAVEIIDNCCVIKEKNSKLINKKINDFIKKNKFTINHYSIGNGNLEEVFRKLTAHD
ncbi:MAG: ATP-binding cassette domain-containing protein [Alphaproteobacteria bacterium TMED93]|nr:MAG: ATP-binding cassette domain-containing protein [Alphaproteobacteria bacterium TMED93]